MKTMQLAFGLALLSLVPVHAAELQLGDAAKGKIVHDKNCTSCHVSMFGGDGSGIYTRADRRIKSLEGLEGQVAGCSNNTGVNLTKDQINDVVKYLNDEYYKF